jgi:hypothetical protein
MNRHTQTGSSASLNEWLELFKKWTFIRGYQASNAGQGGRPPDHERYSHMEYDASLCWHYNSG